MIPPTTTKDQVDSHFSDLGAGGRRFKSSHSDALTWYRTPWRQRAFRSNERSTVSWLVRRYAKGKSDITPESREQYSWAIRHIESELGAIPLSRLDRDDVATTEISLERTNPNTSYRHQIFRISGTRNVPKDVYERWGLSRSWSCRWSV